MRGGRGLMIDGSFPQTERDKFVWQKNIPFSTLPINIASGAALSDGVDLGYCVVCAIQMPAAWTTANLTFQGRCAPELAWMDVYTSTGVEVNVTAAASRFIIVDPSDFAGLRFLRVRSGTTGTPVNQAAGRELRLMVRPI